MCDFSLQSVRSRPAKVGDTLITRDFGTGTRGFAAADDAGLAVCMMPGTELAFADDVACLPAGLFRWNAKISHRTAIFRQINRDKMMVHHDALEFPDGRIVLLTALCEGQAAAACAASHCGRGRSPEACRPSGLTVRGKQVGRAAKRPTFLAPAGSVAACNSYDAVRRGGERWNTSMMTDSVSVRQFSPG